MTATQDILRAGQSIQAVALLGENLKAAKQSQNNKKTEKKIGDITKLGIKNIVGTSLILEQAKITGGL